MKKSSENHRIWIFLIFAFGIAWLSSLAIALTGGIANSPVIFPTLRLRLATLLIATVYMWAPAIANVLTRIITKEGWADIWIRPLFKSGWRYWLFTWLLTPFLVFGGVIIYFLVFSGQYDPTLGFLRKMLPAAVESINPWIIVGLQAFQGILLGVVINSPFTLGEEFGWRAYLLQKLLKFGPRKAILLTGVISGIWHLPVIVMGHNYGLGYPGFPVLGILAMVWFCIGISALFGWGTLRARSIWPAVIGHAVLNGLGSFGILFSTGDINPLLGPSPAGIISSSAFIIFAIWVFLDPRALPSGIDIQKNVDDHR